MNPRALDAHRAARQRALRARAIQLHASEPELPCDIIGQRLGVSGGCVSRWLKEAGQPSKARGGTWAG